MQVAALLPQTQSTCEAQHEGLELAGSRAATPSPRSPKSPRQVHFDQRADVLPVERVESEERPERVKKVNFGYRYSFEMGSEESHPRRVSEVERIKIKQSKEEWMQKLGREKVCARVKRWN